MLSEEGLILLAAFIACALVVLGVLEVIWPTRPRHPIRRPAPEVFRRAQPAGAQMPRPAPLLRETPVSPRVPVVAPLAEAPAGAPDVTAAIEAFELAAARNAVVEEPVPAPPPTIEVMTAAEAATDDDAPDNAPEVVADTSEVAVSTSEVVASAPEIAESAADVVAEVEPETSESTPSIIADPAQSDPTPADPAPSGIPEINEVSSEEAARLFSPPPLRIVPRSGRERGEPGRERGDPRRERTRPSRSRPGLRPTARQLSSGPQATSPEPEPALEPTAEAPALSVVDRCFVLLEEQRLGEVVRLGEEALASRKAGMPPVPGPAVAQETARLWGAIGLAKQGLDDFEGARFAFEEAIAVAPRGERPAWERRLADLALLVGKQAIDEDAPRVDSLRSAIEWLDRGLAVAPDDERLRETLEGARDALWPAHEDVVKDLVQRQEFARAREVLDDILADSDCPPERRRAFRRLYAGAVGGEVERVTTEALRHVQEGREDEATAALAQAGSLIASAGPETLSAKRRGDLEHQLWTACTTLGANRLEAGAHEAAMNLLFRALSLGTIPGERQTETRAMLTRALDAFVNERAASVGRLIDAGEIGAATAQSDKLWTLLRGAVDQSVSEDDVLEAFDKVLGLYRRMGGKRA